MKSPKAQTKLTLTTIIYLVLALIAIVILFTLGARIIDMLNSNQGSAVSFERLKLGVTLLVNNTEAEFCHIPFSLESNEALVGFDKGKSRPVEVAGWIDDDEIARPDKVCPLDKSCLALCDVGTWYTNDNDCKDAQLFDIETFDEVGSFEYLFNLERRVPLVYYGSGNKVEFFTLQKIGDPGSYTILIHDRDEIINKFSKPCEALAPEKEENIKTLIEGN
jgi:hypothetical protein